jgi:predicted dehydrogenase
MNPQSIHLMLVAGLFLAPAVGDLAHAEEPAPLQVALVGCAHIHTPGFIEILKQRKDVKVKCVWDHDPARAKKRAEELGVPAVSDVAVIWADPQIKAVVICSETDRHEELVNSAAKAHKNVYVEKPLGLGGKDAYTMARTIDDAGVLFQTGYFMRGDKNILFIKQQIERNAFGKITRVRGSNCHGGALGGWFDDEWRWMADPKIAGVGAYGDLGTHSLDILVWLMGDVARVTATLAPGTAHYPGCDEFGEGILVFKNGVVGTLAAGWDDVANPVSLEVCGTEGHATIVNGQLHYYDKDGAEMDAAKLAAQLPAALASPLDRFLDAATGKKGIPLVTPDEAAYRSAVMEALYQSAAGQKWVSVPAPPARETK